jgi:hypothetical protein
MSPGMVGKFKPVVLDYAGQHGGNSVEACWPNPVVFIAP